MGKKEESVQETTEFPLTLDEFLSELPATRVEMKAGFRHVMQEENNSGVRLREDWQALLDLYKEQPSSMSWADWIKSQVNAKGGN